MDIIIDEIDQKLLETLKENARLSYAEIGRIINLSPSAVRERIQKMEHTGIIKKYTIEVDNFQIGYEIEAFILLKVYQGKLQQTIKQIGAFPEIIEAHRITGSENIHLKVLLKNQLGIQELLDKLMFYGHTNTYLILSKIKEDKG